MTGQKPRHLYVIDTHVLIWYFTGSHRLHKKLKDKIDTARKQGGCILVPTIVLAESLDIAEKYKVQFDFREMYRLLKEDQGFEIVGFGTEIFDEAVKLKAINEIHDRIISATANFYKVAILTKDRIISESGEVTVVR